MHAFIRVSLSQSAENVTVTLAMETEQDRSLSETPMHSSEQKSQYCSGMLFTKGSKINSVINNKLLFTD